MIRQPFAPQPLREIATLIPFINSCAFIFYLAAVHGKKSHMRIMDYCNKHFLHKSAFWFYPYFRRILTRRQKRVAMRDEEEGRSEIVARMLPSRWGESYLIVAYAITPWSRWWCWYQANLLARCAEITVATTWCAPTSPVPATSGSESGSDSLTTPGNMDEGRRTKLRGGDRGWVKLEFKYQSASEREDTPTRTSREESMRAREREMKMGK